LFTVWRLTLCYSPEAKEICQVHGGSKSTNKKDLKDMSELIARWGGPNISKCDNVVMQALNIHF